MATERDYYEILNVDRDSSEADIKRAYRKLAMKHHPDRNPGDADSERIFKEAAEAYEVLSEPKKRKLYDQFGHAGLRGTSMHDFGHMDVGDIFSMFDDIFGDTFAGPGQRSRDRTRRGYSLETTVEITIEEAAKGADREVEFTRMDTCENCSGSGTAPGSKPVACVACGGQGQVAQQGFGGMFRMVSTCRTCGGSGKVIRDPCRKCDGSGRMPCKRVLMVKVPAGIHDGQAIRISDEGEPAPRGGPRGDLHVVVRIKPHELFAREDDHLILRMPVSFTQVALGAEVAVPTLNGEHCLKIAAGTQHGDVLRVTGQGMPNLRNGQRGDLVVIVLIEIPKKLSQMQTQMLRDFAETEDHELFPHSSGFWDKIKSYLS